MRLRPLRVDGAVAYVPLTRDYEAIVDVKDVDFVSQWNWFAKVKSEKTIYAVRSQSVFGRNQKVVFLHRELLKPDVGVFVDHINGNGLDNRRCNIRLASNAENMRNRPSPIVNRSGYKGVSWDVWTKKWRARIRHDNKEYQLGFFENIEDAAFAYAAAAIKYHGDFARI